MTEEHKNPHSDQWSQGRTHETKNPYGSWSTAADRKPKGLTRREMLGISAITGLAFVLASCREQVGIQGEAESVAGDSPDIDRFAERLNINEIAMSIGPEFDVVETWNVSGLPGWQPDAGIWAIHNSGFKLVIPARRESYVISGNPPKASQIAAPDHELVEGKGYVEYVGMGGGTELPDGRVLGASHIEYWPEPYAMQPGHNFRASVGLHVSEDGGQTFREVGPIIEGQNTKPAAELRVNVAGAGQPAAFVYGDKVRICYIDWSLGLKPDSLSLAECPLDQLENPEAWKKWDGQGFNSPANGGSSESILTPFDYEGKPTHYTALPSIVPFKDGHLMTFETDLGFFAAQSNDGGLNWSQPQLIMEFPQRHGDRQKGQVWYSYPSVVLDNPNEGKGMLFYSKGHWLEDAHQWKGRPIELA